MKVHEIAPDIFRLSLFVPEMNIQFNQFLVCDEEPLLFHLSTGKYRFRFLATPHVPHCWEASLLFEETGRTLFSSDLFFHWGDAEPKTTSDVVGRFKQGLIADQPGPFANAYPYTPLTEGTLQRLAGLKPKTIALMHGSSFEGDGEQALKDLAGVMKEVLGGS